MPPTSNGRPANSPPARSLSISHNFETSNDTSNFFVGTTQRSWMNRQVSTANVIPTAFLNQNPVSLSVQSKSPALNVSTTASSNKHSQPVAVEVVHQAHPAASPPVNGPTATPSPSITNGAYPTRSIQNLAVLEEATQSNKQMPMSQVHSPLQESHARQPNLILSSTGKPTNVIGQPSRRASNSTQLARPIPVVIPEPIRFDTGESPATAAVWPPNLHLQPSLNKNYTTPAMPNSSQPLGPRPVAMRPPVVTNPSPQPQATNPLAIRAQYIITGLRGQRSLSMIEERRLRCVFEACNMHDHFYLYVHQVYCIRTLHPEMLPTINFDVTCTPGFVRLQQVFRSNTELPRETLIALSNFPDPIGTFLGSGRSIYNQQARDFLMALGRLWDGVYKNCQTRDFPPCAQEMAITFSLNSAIMQKIMFTTFHHFLCTPTEAQNVEWASTALCLFENDHIQAFQDRGNGNVVLMRTLNHETVRQFGTEYIRLRTELRARNLSTMIPASAATVNLRQNAPSGRAILPSSVSRTYQEQRRAIAGTPLSEITNSVPARQNRGYQAPYNSSTPTMILPATNRGVVSAQANNGHAGRPPRIWQPANSGVPIDNYALHCFNDNERLLPPANHQMPVLVQPNPDELALHQAHLQSPKVRKVDAVGKPIQATRLYQFVQAFAFAPKIVDRHALLIECSFEVPSNKHLLLAKDIPRAHDFAVHGPRVVTNGSLLYRLKCSLLKNTGLGSYGEFDVAAPVSWPSSCFVSFNDNPDVELRKKSHHGRDLTADLTGGIRCGTNNLTASIYWTREERDKWFAFVIEVVKVVDHAEVLSLVERLSAEESLSAITATLKAALQDDDVMAVDQFVSIDLTDPLTAVMWKTPARGKSCLHRECFDLESFLQSRRSRQENGPTDPDEWKCPICKKDARPVSLVIDGFLAQLRDQLERDGNLEAKAIRVEENGNWEPRFEVSDERGITRTVSESINIVSDVTNVTDAMIKVDSNSVCPRNVVAEQHIEIIEIDD